jgi:hypothetical protein
LYCSQSSISSFLFLLSLLLFFLVANGYPLGLLVIAFVGYVTCFYAKETVAQLTLDVLNVRREGWRAETRNEVVCF